MYHINPAYILYWNCTRETEEKRNSNKLYSDKTLQINQTKEQHCNTTILSTKKATTPETRKNSRLRWASSSGQTHSISGTAVWGWKVTVWLCWAERLWDSITGLWLADGAASKAVYAEMHPAFHGRACLLKCSVSALSLGRRELWGDVTSALWADSDCRTALLHCVLLQHGETLQKENETLKWFSSQHGSYPLLWQKVKNKDVWSKTDTKP